MDIVRKQDMPPPGGYKSFNVARVPAKSVIGGKALIAANLALTAGALYLYSLNYRKLRTESVEMRSSMLAIMPTILAEHDRSYLKELRKNRDEEANLMKDVEGWEVGTYYGQPIYSTIPKDTLMKPHFFEYMVHTSPKDHRKVRDITLWV